MIETYSILADRIEKELNEIARVVGRAERAIAAASQSPEGQDLFVDAAALNLHDFFGGIQIERLVQQMSIVFTQIRTELLVFASFLRQVGGDDDG